MKLGLFDSGIGGLTIVERLLAHSPSLSILYFGDTAYTPYGEKSPSWIIDRSLKIGCFLKEQGATALAIGCGTASICAINTLKSQLEIPVFGVIDSIIESASGKQIGLLATTTTIHDGRLTTALQNRFPYAEINPVACPEFVPLLESWSYEASHIEEAIAKILPKIRQCDTVILGCTHYPLLAKKIAEKLEPRVTLVNIAEVAAKKFFLNFTSQILPSHPSQNLLTFVSSNPLRFQKVSSHHFPNLLLNPVKLVEEKMLSGLQGTQENRFALHNS